MTFWTEQREEQLRTLWIDGHSAAVIHQQMRAPSRNAVLGKAHRLGLPLRDKKNRHLGAPKRRAEPKPRAPKPSRIATNTNGFLPRIDSKPPIPVKLTDVEQTNEFPIVYGCPQALLSRPAEQCGFPMGDGEQFHFCTNRKRHGSHYCDGHHLACWVPAPKRDRT